MDFYNWINLVIREWVNTGRSESQLAREIGISQATLNAMKNRSRGMPKDRRIIDALINFYRDTHPEVYEVLDVPRPYGPVEMLESFGFPSEVARELSGALLAVLASAQSRINQKGISKDSPEAREIIKEELSKSFPHLKDTK